MEIINKSHHQIRSNKRVDLAAYFKVERSKKAIYFSTGAADQYGIMPGIRVNFINDDDDWFFYCDNNKDGFLLTNRSGKKAGLLCDTSLVHLFLKRTRTSPETKFPITLTKNEVYGCPVFKIELNKPIEE